MSPRRLLPVLAAVVSALALTLPASSATAATASSVTLTFVGDMILGSTPQLPASPGGYLTPVGKELRAGSDIVFANREGTLTSTGTSKCPYGSGGTCFAFRNPPAYARPFASTGFGVLGLAN